MNTEQRKKLMAQMFMTHFGGAPILWCRAPGRVDLMGSHTDYNLGYVMTMSVDRDTWIAARPRTDHQVSIASLNLSGRCEFSLDDIQPAHDPALGWTNYVRGVAHVLQAAGYVLTGFDGLIHSTIPLGSGLSSSAALEMATAIAFQHVSDFRLEAVEMARLGQQAENQFVGVSCGILDQYSSVLGRSGTALLLDCRDLTSISVPIHPNIDVVICDTKAERQLAGTEYTERRRQCEAGVHVLQQWDPAISSLRDVSIEVFEQHKQDLDPIVARRCQFIIEENNRVLELQAVLPRGDMQQLHHLFHASYVGARDLYEIGVPAMEAMMNAMLEGPGVIAARQAGAGFGGCMVALVEAQSVQYFVPHVAQVYTRMMGAQPTMYRVAAVDGAGLLHTDWDAGRTQPSYHNGSTV